MHWDLAAFQRELLRRQQADPNASAQSTFHFAWIMGCLGDPEAAIRKATAAAIANALAHASVCACVTCR